MNSDILKGKMKEERMTQKDVAEAIGISLSRFNAKLNNKGDAEFSLGEIRSIKELLSLNPVQVDQIFFA